PAGRVRLDVDGRPVEAALDREMLVCLDLDPRAPHRRELGVTREVPLNAEHREVDVAEVRGAEAAEDKGIEFGFGIAEVIGEIAMIVVDMQVANGGGRRAGGGEIGHLTTPHEANLGVRVHENAA